MKPVATGIRLLIDIAIFGSDLFDTANMVSYKIKLKV
jgi:hypothetical protein